MPSSALAAPLSSFPLRAIAPIVRNVNPFASLLGPALVVNFEFAPARYEFQRLPFHNALVVAQYHHVVFETFFAHLRNPHLQTRTGVGFFGDHDFAAVRAKLGDLSTKYLSLLQSQSSRAADHPTSGSIELTEDPHRAAHGLKLSLWDAERRPLSLLWLTGPRAASDTPQQRAALEAAKAETTGGSMLEEDLSASFLAPEDGSGGGGDHVALAPELRVSEAGALSLRALFPAPSNFELECIDDAVKDAVPPWLLDDLITRFAARIAQRFGYFSSSSSPSSSYAPPLVLCAQNTTTLGDVAYGVPLTVACALPPNFHPRFRLAPWERVAGKPFLALVPCLELNVHLSQRRKRVLFGTHYFCCAVPGAEGPS